MGVSKRIRDQILQDVEDKKNGTRSRFPSAEGVSYDHKGVWVNDSVMDKIWTQTGEKRDDYIQNMTASFAANRGKAIREAEAAQRWQKTMTQRPEEGLWLPDYMAEYSPYSEVEAAAQQRKVDMDEDAFHRNGPFAQQFDDNYQAYLLGRRSNSPAAIQARSADLNNRMKAIDRHLMELPDRMNAVTDRNELQRLHRVMANLQQERGGIEAELEQLKAAKYDNQLHDDILAAGGEELIEDLSRLSSLRRDLRNQQGSRTPHVKGQLQTEAESRDLMNKLRGAYGDNVDTWLEYMDRIADAEAYDDSTKAMQDFASDHPFAGSLARVPLNLASGAGVMDIAAQMLKNKVTGSEAPINYKSPAMALGGMADAATGAVAQDIEKATKGWIGSDTIFGNLYSMAYQTGMSMADSLGIMGLGAAGLPGAVGLLGGSAARSGIQEAHERGATDGQALLFGLLAGTAETLFENVSLENLFNMKSTDGIIKNLMKQSGVEASEEVLTTVANTISDALVMGGKSEIQTNIRNYMDMGKSYDEAAAMAGKDWAIGLANDAIGGFVSGGLFGVGGQAVSSIADRHNQKLLQAATDMNVGSKSDAAGTVSKSENVVPDTNVGKIDDHIPDPTNMISGKDSNVPTSDRLANRQAATSEENPVVRTGENAERTERSEASEAVGILRRNSKAFGAEGKKILTEFYDESQEADDYLGGFAAYYEAGVSGRNVDEVRTPFGNALTDQQKEMAYTAGKIDAHKSLQAEQAAVGKAVIHKNGKLVRNKYTAGMNARDFGALNKLASATGTNIEIVDSLEHDAEGVYDPKTGTIKLSARAESPLLTVASHEVTHRLQTLAPEEYRTFRDYVMNRTNKERGRYAIQEIVERYAEDGVQLNTEEAMDEIAAEFVEHMVKDRSLFEELAEKNRKVAKSLLDTIKQFIADVKEKFRGKKAMDSATMAQYGVDMDTMVEAAKLWEEALGKSTEVVRKKDGAGRNANNEESGQANEGKIKHSFGGKRAANADLEALTLAKQMEQSQIDSETVRQETGWFRGADGKWRFEIDNSGMKYNSHGDNRALREFPEYRRYRDLTKKAEAAMLGLSGEELTAEETEELQDLRENWAPGAQSMARSWMDTEETVEDYIQDDELFAAYPWIKDMGLQFVPFEDGTLGQYDEDKDTIFLDESLRRKPQETIIHEIQHAIQGYERFARGSSPEYWAEKRKEAVENLSGANRNLQLWLDDIGYDKAVKTSMMDVVHKKKTLDQHWKDMAEFKANSEYADQIAKSEAEVKAFEKELQEIKRGHTPTEQYRNTAGEIEARDAEARMNLTAEQRRTTRPDTGEDRDVFFVEKNLPVRFSLKRRQSAVIQNANKAEDDIHTWIRSEDDILTFDEAVDGWDEGPTPDYTYAMIEKAKKTGRIMVYSSKPIEQGTFVSPSKMEAMSYAGGNKVYSKEVGTDEVAWIDEVQGQYANVKDGERYSIKKKADPDEAKKAAALQKENDMLRQRVSYWKSQTKKTSGHKTDSRAVAKAARNLQKQIGSDAEITQDLQQLYDGIASGSLTGEEAYTGAADIAGKLITTAVDKDDSMYQDYAELRKQMRSTRITISEADARNIPDLQDIRRSNRGRMRITVGDRTNVDSIYKELAETYPEFFDEVETPHPADQLMQIADVLDGVYTINEFNPYDRNMEQAITGTANEIMETFFDLPEIKTYADKMDRKMLEQQLRADAKLAKEKNRSKEKADKLRAEGKAAVRDARTADDMYYGRQMAEQKRTSAEKLAQAKSGASGALEDSRLADQMYYGGKLAEQQRTSAEKLADARRTAKENAADERLASDMYYGRQMAEQQRTSSERLEKAKQEGKQAAENARLAGDMYYGRKLAENQRKAGERLDTQKQKTRDTKTADEMYYGRQLLELRKQNQKATAEAIQKERTRRETEVNRLKEVNKAKDAVGRDRRNAREIRQKIVRHAKQLSVKLLQPTDNQHIPQELRPTVAAALATINMESKRGSKMGADGKYHSASLDDPNATPSKRTEAFLKVRQQYEEIAKGDQPYTLVVDPDLMDNLAELAQMSDVKLDDMNLDQLRTVWATVKALEASILTANKAFSAVHFATIQEAADGIRDDNQFKAERKNLNNRTLNSLDKLTGVDMMTPEAFFHRLGKTAQNIFQMLRDAQDKHITVMDEARQYTEEAVGETKIRDLEKDLKTFDTTDGEKVTMSVAQIMTLYELLKRQQAIDHITIGGIRPTALEQKGLTQKKPSNPVRVSLEDCAEIVASLTDDQKKMADKLQSFMGNRLSDLGNEASMQVYGYEKFNEDNYFPIKVDSNQTKTDVSKEAQAATIAGRGFTKATQVKARNAVMVGSIFDVFAQHVTDMATYYSWLAPMEDLRRILDFSFWEETEDGVKRRSEDVKSIIERVFGSGGGRYLKQLIDDINQGVKATNIGDFTDVLTGNFKAAAIGANARVVLQQPTAILRAAAVMDWKYLAQAKPSMKKWETVKKYAPIAIWKDWGYFDVSTGRSMKNVLFGDDGKLQKVTEALMAPAGYADSVTWSGIWSACEAEITDTTKLEPGTEEFYKKVAERFNEVIDKTQVVDGLLQRSQIMRSGDKLNKTASSFMAEPTKTYNLFVNDLYDLRQQPKNNRKAARQKLRRTVVALSASFAVNAAVQALVDAFRDDDREKDYWEKFWAKWIENFGSNYNPLSYVPYLKDAVSLLSGYDVTRMDMEPLAKTAKASSNLMKALSGDGKMSLSNAMLSWFAEASRIVGLPVANIKRDVLAILNTAANESGSLIMQYYMDKALLNPGYQSNKGRFMDLLYAAKKTDGKAYTKIMQDLIKSGYTVEYITKGMEDRMKKDQGVNSASELDERFMVPEDQKIYDGMMGKIDGSKVWTSGTDAHRNYAKDVAYQIATGSKSGQDYQAKADELGLSDADYILYKTALKIADANSEDPNGSPDKDETEEALRMLKLSNGKKADIWDIFYKTDNPFN